MKDRDITKKSLNAERSRVNMGLAAGNDLSCQFLRAQMAILFVKPGAVNIVTERRLQIKAFLADQ